MNILKQNVSATLNIGPFINSDDGKSRLTDLVITSADVKLSKNGSPLAHKVNSVSATPDVDGFYIVQLSPTDIDTTGRLLIEINNDQALPYLDEYTVVPQSIYDWFIDGAGISTSANNLSEVNSVSASNYVFSDVATLVNNNTIGLVSVINNITSNILNSIVDGDITVVNTLMRLLSYIGGNVNYLSNTNEFLYYKRDGVTSAFGYTIPDESQRFQL